MPLPFRLLSFVLAGAYLAVPVRLPALPPPDEPSASFASALEKGKVLRRSYYFEAAKRRMPYALYVPTGYQPDRPAPVIVLLHGLASNPFQVIRYLGVIKNAEERGYIVAAPDGYGAAGWYGSQGPGRNFRIRWFQSQNTPENLGELSEQDVLNVLSEVRKQFRIDPARIYLMGHSMGGGGTLHLGMKYPKIWAALVALSPAIYSDPDELKALRHLPVLVVQGEADALVKAGNTRLYVEKMKQLGVPHEYLEIEGGDHVLSIAANPRIIDTVFDFLNAHRR